MSDPVQYVGSVKWRGYLVGTDGSVWSYWHRPKACVPAELGSVPHQLSRGWNKGYPLHQLCRGGKAYTVYVHRLVLETFVGQRPPGSECRHFPDSDPANCSLDNLSWGTRSENEADKLTHGTYQLGSKNTQAKLTAADVAAIRSLITGGCSRRQIAKQYQVASSTIDKIAWGKNWGWLP